VGLNHINLAREGRCHAQKALLHADKTDHSWNYKLGTWEKLKREFAATLNEKFNLTHVLFFERFVKLEDLFVRQ